MENDPRWYIHYLSSSICPQLCTNAHLMMLQLLLPVASFTSSSQKAPASHQFTNIIHTDINGLPLSSNTTKMPRPRISVWPKVVEQDHPGETLRKYLVLVLRPYLLICGLVLLVTDSDWGLSILIPYLCIFWAPDAHGLRPDGNMFRPDERGTVALVSRILQNWAPPSAPSSLSPSCHIFFISANNITFFQDASHG